MLRMCKVCNGTATNDNVLSSTGRYWTHLYRENWENNPHDVVLQDPSEDKYVLEEEDARD